MGYLHINNLYSAKGQEVLLFKRCYALEKVHGTSSHIAWKDGLLSFFAGGAPHETFKSLFDYDNLIAKLAEKIGTDKIAIYGEAYGGKMQGMRHVYGNELRFIAFDVQREGYWLDVPGAARFVESLGLEFVPWVESSTDLVELDSHRDKPSEVAIRRGCGNDKQGEGIVIRPLAEMTNSFGERIISKHKTANFRETTTPRDASIDPAKLLVLADAKAVSDEWCTARRLQHILDKLPGVDIKDTKQVLDAMVEDIQREGVGEILWSKEVEGVIRKTTAAMFKKHLVSLLRESCGNNK